MINADGLQPAQNQEGAVDVVHAPAPEPASIRLLLAENELNGLLDALVSARIAIAGQHLQHAPGNVHRRRIEHGVVIGEGDVLEDHLGIVFVEAAPAAVLALHGELPCDGALGHLMLVALAGIVHLVERHQHLRGVVGVGIKLVVELEVPAAGLGVGNLHGPVALVANLFGEHPIHGLEQARVVALHAGLAQGEDRLRRIPHRRDSRQHTEGRLGHHVIGRLFDAQLFKLIARPDHLRIVLGVTQAAKSDDGVQHGRIDRAQAVSHLQPRQQPLFRALESQRAQRADMHRFGPVHEPVKNDKEVAPREE